MIFLRLSLITFLAIVSPLDLKASIKCLQTFNPVASSFAILLHHKYPDHHKKKAFHKSGDSVSSATLSSTPDHVIFLWILRTSSEFSDIDEAHRRKLQRLVAGWAVTYDEISEKYFEHHLSLMRQRGLGQVSLELNQRRELARLVRQNQIESLGPWFSYLTSENSGHIPFWAKYWILLELRKVGRHRPESTSFSKRRRGDTAIFPDLRPDALAAVVDRLTKYLNGSLVLPPNSPEEEVLRSLNFSKLYAQRLSQTKRFDKGSETLKETRGSWVTYPQGTSPTELCESLRGHETGWCTEQCSTAETQLIGGDFHVYYSNDGFGKPTHPRIAIRMKGKSIAEIRGIGPSQALDPDIEATEILKNRLVMFEDEVGATFLKKDADAKRLTVLELAQNNGEPFSRSDLEFLYETHEKIQTFALFGDDPRIKDIKNRRNRAFDFAIIHDLDPDQVTDDPKKAFDRGIRYFIGDLDMNASGELVNIVFPENVIGSVRLDSVTHLRSVTFPKRITKDLSIPSVHSLRDVTFPIEVGGNFSNGGALDPWGSGASGRRKGLTALANTTLPRIVRGRYGLDSLVSAKNVDFGDFAGSLMLPELRSATNVKFSTTVQRRAVIGLLSGPATPMKFDHVILPKAIGESLDLQALASLKGVVGFPETINGVIILRSLLDPWGLELLPASRRGFQLSESFVAEHEKLVGRMGIHLLDPNVDFY